MLPSGYHNPPGFKTKRMLKVKTCSGEDDRNLKKILDSYRNTKAFETRKESKLGFKEMKRSSEYSENSHRILKGTNYSKENYRNQNEPYKTNDSYKPPYRNQIRVALPGNELGEQPTQKQSLIADRSLGLINCNIPQFQSKINKNTTRIPDFLGEGRFLINPINSDKKENRYINLSSRRLDKNKMGLIKVQKESLSYEEKKRVFYQTCSIKGSKQYNQDNIKASDGVWIVCDGHGENGHNVSWYIVNQRKARQKISKTMLTEIFMDVEKHLEESGIEIALSGTTCVMVVLDGDKIFCACAGDSVAIAIKDNQSYTIISSEHKPCNPQEAKRIEYFGGVVKKTTGKEHLAGSPLRMWGKGVDHWGPGLAISRSFGDMMGQKYGLIYEPEIKEIDITGLKFIVMGSDGLFDQVTPTEMANILSIESEGHKTEGCKILAEIAQSRWQGYSDDISAIVIYL